MSGERSWIYTFFGGKEDLYAGAFNGLLHETRTLKEVVGILKLLKPEPGSRILDWCGRWGRHAILLALRGFKVILLDFCQEYIEMAKAIAAKAGVEIETVCADFRDTPASIQADYAINIFTAGLGYLTEKDDLIALCSLHAALKPGAKFLIDTLNPFWVIRNFAERDWEELSGGTKRLLEQRRFDHWTNRCHTTFILQDLSEGTEKQAQTEVHLYSAAELARLLRRAGFEPIELYGSLDGADFDFDSKRIVMISKRL